MSTFREFSQTAEARPLEAQLKALPLPKLSPEPERMPAARVGTTYGAGQRDVLPCRQQESDHIVEMLVSACRSSNSDFESTVDAIDLNLKNKIDADVKNKMNAEGKGLSRAEVKDLQSCLMEDLVFANRDVLAKFGKCMVSKLANDDPARSDKLIQSLKALSGQDSPLKSVLARGVLSYLGDSCRYYPWEDRFDQDASEYRKEMRATTAYKRLGQHPNFDRIATIPANVTPAYSGSIEEEEVVDPAKLQKDIESKRQHALKCWSEITDGGKTLKADDLAAAQTRYQNLRDDVDAERHALTHLQSMSDMDGQVRAVDLTGAGFRSDSAGKDSLLKQGDLSPSDISSPSAKSLADFSADRVVDILMDSALHGNKSEFAGVLQKIDDNTLSLGLKPAELKRLEGQIVDDVFSVNREAAAVLARIIMDKLPITSSQVGYNHYSGISGKDFDAALTALYREGKPVSAGLAVCLYRARSQMPADSKDGCDFLNEHSFDSWVGRAQDKTRYSHAYSQLRQHPGFDDIAVLDSANDRPKDIGEIEFGQSVDTAKLKQSLETSRKQLVDAWKAGDAANYYALKGKVNAMRYLQTHMGQRADESDGKVYSFDL